MYKVHQGHYGNVPGDGFELISSHIVAEFETREEAWSFICDEKDFNQRIEMLVELPEMCMHPYPSRWDIAPPEALKSRYMRC